MFWIAESCRTAADAFEANAHYANLVNQLSLIGRDVARRCQTSSTLRFKLREFELAGKDAWERLAVVEQGAMSNGAQAAELGRVGEAVARMRKVMETKVVADAVRNRMSSTSAGIEAELERVGGGAAGDTLDMIAMAQREAYR